MKLIFTIIFALVGCNVEKTTPIFQDSLSLSSVKNINKSSDKQLLSLKLDENNPQSTGPTRFPLDPNRVSAWLDEISEIATLDNPKNTYKINGLSPENLQIIGVDYTYDISAYEVSPNWAYLVIRGLSRGQSIARAAYLESQFYKKLFIDFNELRIKKIPVPNYDEIDYVVDDKKFNLNRDQKNKLVEWLKAIDITKYAHDGVVDVGILKNTKVGERINKNIKGYFVFIDGEKKTKVMFGRHHEAYFLARIWIEGHDEIWEAQFPQWPELNAMENELVK